ncbi:hypothetical protein D3C81_1985380 [compost metagenome]
MLSNFGYITSFDYIEVDEKEFSIQPHQKLCLLAVLIGKNPIDDFIKFYRFNDITKNKYEELYNAYFKEEKIENRLKHQITTIKKILEDK